jgi:hypothetical protein
MFYMRINEYNNIVMLRLPSTGNRETISQMTVEPQTRTCGQKLANETCRQMAAVGKLEKYRDGKLSAIHEVISCPKCGIRVEIERLEQLRVT